MSGIDIQNKLERGEEPVPPIIFHEDLTEANFKKTKYISFTDAKFLIDTDSKKDIYKAKAKELSDMCNNIIELIPRLFKRMNRVIAEYHHKKQQDKLREYQEQEESMKERAANLAAMYPDRTLKKDSYIYAFTSKKKLEACQVKIGIASNIEQRLSSLKTSEAEGYYLAYKKLYNAKASELQHNMLKLMGLQFELEWFIIPNKEIIEEIFDVIVENEDKL